MGEDGPSVGDLGEFGLIDRLAAILPGPKDARLVVGIGDDAAVWRAGDGYVIATTDTMVAGVHFVPDAVPWRDVGWKALASNITDIAAMGGVPSFALVTLCLPPETPVRAVDELYAGLRECADAHGIVVAGGDIVSSPVFTVTVALAGEARLAPDGESLLLRRNAASAGDVVAVTGPLGGSGGGLRALVDGHTGSDAAAALIRRHMRPSPRVDAARAALDAGVRCGIDISDGLVQDLQHVCDASGVGAEVAFESIPLDPSLVAAYPDDARVIAATAGEDYELLLVAPADLLADASAALGAPLIVVGRIVEGEPRVRVLDVSGNDVPLDAGGFDHFRRP